jgi:alkaline phosphatase
MNIRADDTMKNRLRALFPALATIIPATLFLAACDSGTPPPGAAPRNLVFLLGDGMGPAQVKAYRMYADDPATELVDPLPMEAYQVGSVSTDSIVLDCGDDAAAACTRDPYGFTDSASSATAYATGRDTVVGRISMSQSGETMTTILEGARMQGKSTGLVATSQITHATPAAFGSHVEFREQFTRIADQYFDNQWNGEPMVDVLLGGGLDDMKRRDRNLVSEFRQAGYDVALKRTELLNTQDDRLLGLFAPAGLPRAWDRGSDVPSLAEMTAVALRALDRNPQGFFLMVEGSQVDWASHDNSVVGVISEMEDFIAAIRVVLDFAQQRGDTLVVITADHETGGMSLGRDDIYRWNPRPLHGVKLTPAAMTATFLAGEESLSKVVAGSVPFELSETEMEALDAATRDEITVMAAITTLFNKRTYTGWSSPGHTGVDVPLYVYGPGSERFHGVMQNEVVGQVLWSVFLPAR